MEGVGELAVDCGGFVGLVTWRGSSGVAVLVGVKLTVIFDLMRI